MNLQEAINDRRVNLFDISIIDRKNGVIKVTTYQRPGESQEDFEARDERNIKKAEQIINKKAR